MATERTRGARWLREVDVVFAGLSHATRRQILLTLHFSGGAMTAGEIAGRFEYAWPTITRHLTELRIAGLVDCALVGRERHYRLRREFFERIREWLAWFDVEPQTTDRTAGSSTSRRASSSTAQPSSKARRARATY